MKSWVVAAGVAAFGTAASTRSKAWYTGADGVLSDVYSPTIENSDDATLQYIVTDGRSFTALQQRRRGQTAEVDTTPGQPFTLALGSGAEATAAVRVARASACRRGPGLGAHPGRGQRRTAGPGAGVILAAVDASPVAALVTEAAAILAAGT